MAGRTASGALWGFLFFLFVALDLVLFGVVPLNSPAVTILPLVGLVGGVLLGRAAATAGAAAGAPLSTAAPAAPFPAASYTAAQPAAPVGDSPTPAGPPPTPAFAPTNTVPASGLPAWTTPDPSTPVAADLDPWLPVQVVSWYGDWAQILCANGWQAWIDGRKLEPLQQ